MSVWRRRRSSVGPGVEPVPAGTDLQAAAAHVVETLRTRDATDEYSGDLESIEVVQVTVGQDLGQDPEPGLCMTWAQGERKFGLVMPIRRVAQQAGALDAAPFYLQLAVDEPHRGSADGSRRWFLDLPSGPF